jgi:tetratricopeptide (TPR) repeat protein
VIRIGKLLRGGVCLLALGGIGRAQNLGPLTLPAPLVRTTATESAGAHAKTMAEAQLAQDLGFPSVAAEFYRKALTAPNADRVALRLALATALLDAAEPQEAEKALAEIPEPRNAAWHLRAGLAAVQLRKIDAARAALAAIRENEVSVEDYPWYWFFQGQIVDLAPVREISRANSFYQRAENVAMTELSRSRFQLAAERTRLEMKIARDVDPNVHRENYERNLGTQWARIRSTWRPIPARSSPSARNSASPSPIRRRIPRRSPSPIARPATRPASTTWSTA